MRVVVTVPDEIAEQAQASGLPVEAYVQRLVEEAAHGPETPPRPRSPEQIKAFFEAMAEGSSTFPAIPTENFTRESFYQDRVG
jgi:aminoglycoside phosphotransferase (APT) family kinase protein